MNKYYKPLMPRSTRFETKSSMPRCPLIDWTRPPKQAVLNPDPSQRRWLCQVNILAPLLTAFASCITYSAQAPDSRPVAREKQTKTSWKPLPVHSVSYNHAVHHPVGP